MRCTSSIHTALQMSFVTSVTCLAEGGGGEGGTSNTYYKRTCCKRCIFTASSTLNLYPTPTGAQELLARPIQHNDKTSDREADNAALLRIITVCTDHFFRPLCSRILFSELGSQFNLLSLLVTCAPAGLTFYVLLTLHPGMTPGKWPTWCTITLHNTFIIMCNLHTGWSLTENTIPDAVLIQFGHLMMRTVLLETYKKVKQSRYRPGQAQRVPGS